MVLNVNLENNEIESLNEDEYAYGGLLNSHCPST